MEENSAIVLDLWEQMRSGDPDIINDAVKKLDEFFNSPESVMIILNIAQNHPDIQIKKYSIVNAYRLINRHEDNLSPDAKLSISQQIMELLGIEVDMNSKIILCDILTIYYKNSILPFDDLFSTSTQMLQDENRNFAPVGLYLISQLIDQDHLSSFQIDLIHFLINNSLQFLQEPTNFDASSYDLFRISYCFFGNLIGLISLHEDIMSLFQSVTEYLQNEYQVIYGPNGIGSEQDTELEVQLKLQLYFDLMGALAGAEPIYFGEIFAPIIPEINSNLINKDISLDTRLSSLTLLVAISKSIPDLMDELFVYVRNTVLFAIELFEFYEDLEMISRPSEIYQNICENFYDLDQSEILGKFIPNIQELDSMDNLGAFIAIFMLLDSIQSFCLEAIIEQFESIQPLFVKGISSGNPYALEIITCLISNFCQADKSIACNILYTLEQGLLPYANYDNVIRTLKDIYDFSGKEPTDPSLSFNTLVEQITSSQEKYHIELSVECLGYLVLNAESVLTNYFEQVHPIITQLLATNDTSCCASAIFCISTFASKSANLIKNDIPQIVEVIINGIPEKDTRFDQYAATLVINFVDIYPQSFAEFCPQILVALISIINDKEFYAETMVKTDEEELDDNGESVINEEEIKEKQRILELYSAMRDDVFSAIATIFGTYPSELSEQSDQIAQIIMSSSTGKSNDEEEDTEIFNLYGFYQSLTEVIPGFIQIGKNPDELINSFFESRHKMDIYDTNLTEAVSFWNSLKIIIAKCGAPFIIKYGEEILNIVAETYESKEKWKIYSQKTKSKKFIMRKDFIVPITTTVGRFFHDFGGDGWLADAESTPAQFVEKGVVIMQNIIQSTKFASAEASKTIADIIVSCGNNPQFNELSESVLKTVYPDLVKSKISDSREAAFDTISTLVYTQNSVALEMLNNQDCIQNLLESTQEVIGNEESYQDSLITSAAILWCGIVMAFDVDIPQEFLGKVLNHIPPPPHSSMLEFVAQFAAYAAEKWPEVFDNDCLVLVGISVFASKDHYIRNVKIEYMKMLAEVLRNTPPERIEEELKSNENYIMTVQAHVEQVLAIN